MPFYELAGALGVTLALLGSVAASPLQSAATSVIPPERMPQMPSGVAVSPHARRLMLSAMGQMASPRGLSLRTRSIGGETLVPLLVQVAGGAATLKNAGFAARSLSPSFAAVQLPPSALNTLWQVPGLSRVDGSRTLRPRLDKSAPLIGATALHDLGLVGDGVMVAVIDTGIDFRHADFRNSDGSSRIAFLLDAQTSRGSMHPELPPSDDIAVYTKADLDTLLAAEAAGTMPPMKIPEVDTNGHGTHVAGIAAGNGHATGNKLPGERYVGIAPAATLCVVNATRADDSFADQDILTGVGFCLDRAAALNLPVAVNLSLGSAGGPHDGSSAVEMALDELMGDTPGRAVLAAAGNSGEDDIHASSRLFDGTHEIPIHVATGTDPVSGMSQLAVELYFDTAASPLSSGDGTGHINLELWSPSGKVLRAMVGESNRGQFTGEGIGLIDNSDDAMTGLRSALVLINGEDQGSAVATGDWRVRIIGTTLRYDVWMVDATTDLDVRFTSHLDPDSYVEIPAAAKSAISIGAMRSRDSWTRVNGNQVMLSRELLHVAPFSSGGPTTDGRFAPDVLAPGEFIISSLSTAAPATSPNSVFFTPDDPGFLVADDGVHGVLRGTSQATPHVTGAVALLLELSPGLTGTAVRELLRTTATVDNGLSSYGPRRGFGTLDLRTALAALRGGPPGSVDVFRSDLGVNHDAIAPGVGQAVITVTPRDNQGLPLGPGLHVDISSDAGDFVGPTVDTGFGRYERVLVARGPRGTRATIHAHAVDVDLQRVVTVDFVGDSSEVGAPYVVGSCAMADRSPSRESAGGLMIFFAAGLVGLLGRRRMARLCGLLGLWTLVPACSPPDSPAETTAAIAVNAATPQGRARRARSAPGGDYYWQGTETLEQPSIVVHLGEQMAEIFDGQTLVGRTSVCSGRRSHPTPAGHYAVLEKIPEHVSNRYGDYVDDSGVVVRANIDNLDGPPPIGAQFRGTKMPYFLRIVGGIGLHAGPLPGFPDSHGCIRLPPFIAQRLFNVPVGTPVSVEE